MGCDKLGEENRSRDMVERLVLGSPSGDSKRNSVPKGIRSSGLNVRDPSDEGNWKVRSNYLMKYHRPKASYKKTKH